jgi:hypothetical protein
MLNIILRTCDNIEKFSSHNGLPRPYGSKKDIIKTCLDSLVKSIWYMPEQDEVKVMIVDDHSSLETTSYLLKVLAEDLPSRGYMYDTIESGNGASLKYCYELAKNIHMSTEDLFFFVEDDYLFEESAISECLDIYRKAKQIFHKDIIVHPVDYPDRYKNIYQSYIILGENRHWRTIKHTTGTFLVSADVLLKRWTNYMAFTEIGIDPYVTEDTSINKVYEEYPCVSPMPTLAEHYQEPFTLSPFSEYK